MKTWNKLEVEPSPFPIKRIPPVMPDEWKDDPTGNKKIAKVFFVLLGFFLIIFFLIIPIMATVFHIPAGEKIKHMTLIEQLDYYQAKANKK
jgi:hypothetical protein